MLERDINDIADIQMMHNFRGEQAFGIEFKINSIRMCLVTILRESWYKSIDVKVSFMYFI